MKNSLVYAALLMMAIVLSVSSCQKNQAEGSDSLNTKNYAMEVADCLMPGLADSLHLSVDVDFIEPNPFISDTVREEILRVIVTESFGEDYAEMSDINAIIQKFHDDVLLEYRQDYMPIYEQIKESEDEEIGLNLNNEHMLMVYPMTLQGKVLSYVVERYIYQGGAHGINNRRILNFDITTGQILTEQDLFKDEFFGKIHELLLQNLVRQRDDMSLIEDVQNSDYEVNAIKPNGNFYFALDGLVYIYNPYEIGPYYLGETVILVPTAEIKPLLKDTWLNIYAE